MKSRVWIGLVGLTPRQGNRMLEGAKGAFVNVVAFVSDADQYRQQVTCALNETDFDVFDIDDVEPFDDRRSSYEVDDAIIALADECQKDHAISLGAFYPFTEDVQKQMRRSHCSISDK